jgi:hypothetical protein
MEIAIERRRFYLAEAYFCILDLKSDMSKIGLVEKMTLQNDFSKSEHIITYLNEHLLEFKNCFQSIKDLLYKPFNGTNYKNAVENFIKVFDILPLMMIKLPSEMAIIRARANYNDEMFFQQSEISYHPNPINIPQGRFNAPGVQIFYGALPIPDNELNFSLTSCLESCKALISKESRVKVQDMTIGLWRLNETMPVVNLCIDKLHLATNLGLQEASIFYLDELKKYYSADSYEFIHEFMSYFSELSRITMSNDECYYILSALFAAIRYYYIEVMNVPFTGLIFPSCATEGVGLNIALVPNAVDYILRLDKVGMQRFILNDLGDTYNSQPCCELVDVVNQQFHLKKSL